MPSLYLIDAHAYLHRAYHALPPLTTSRGQPVNAIYGFLRMLMKILRQYKPDYLAICFDTAAPTFRHKAFSAYKATRKETEEALVSQFPLAREAAAALQLAAFEADGFEADDLIAHLTRLGRAKGCEVVIVSSDKDALQLVDSGVRVLNESKDILYDADKVRERYGVAPQQIPDIFALMGDSSDNVPGVKGIGEKTAIKLIQEHGDLDSLLKSASQIPGKVGSLLAGNADAARQSRALVALDREVPVTVEWEKCRVAAPNPQSVIPFLKRVEFMALLKDLVPPESRAADLEGRTYTTILTEEALRELACKAAGCDRLAVDVETTGLDPLRADLVGIAMACESGSAYYIPLKHQTAEDPSQLSLETVRSHLRSVFAGDLPRIYGHNLKFDAAVLARHGIPLGRLHCDTMVASYVLNPSRNNHGLKDLVLELLGHPMTSIEELIGKGAKQIRMDAVAIDKASPYACADADMTLRLAAHLEPQMIEKKLDKLFYEMEMPLVPILAEMESQGIRIDRPYLAALGPDLGAKTSRLEKQIHDLAGGEFNINSPKQLSVVLFEKLQLPVIRRTKTGISTDEEVLRKLSELHALPKHLMDYRELQKLKSTYVDALLEAAEGPEDRVHSNFNQTVAATGRLSSSDPNLQNIPIRTEVGRQIRKAFIPKEGWTLLSADYSQIDLRMLAHISRDETLCAAFRQGADIHTATASDIFGVAPAAVTPELRRVAKSINFGIVYGMSPFGLSQQLSIPLPEAQAHIARYFERYPGVNAWIQRTLAEARRDGYVRTLLGRIRYLPEITSANGSMRGFAERTAMNTPIQGTSADVIKLAMIELAKAARRGAWKGNMLVQVHDELLFEIPPDELAASRRVVRELMEGAIALCIPLVVDLKEGKNWAEMKAVK